MIEDEATDLCLEDFGEAPPVSEPVRVFIGYDPREAVAYHVLCHSIIRRASCPVMITPIALHNFKLVFSRERNPLQSTDFAFARFLVPWACHYEGWALFMDCDMLMRADISQLWLLRDYRYALQVVKHDYIPCSKIKFLDQPQIAYPRKNWSSMILFNNGKCRALTPKYINEATGLELHQFKWLEDDRAIGSLSPEWNHLVGEYAHDPNAKLVHFTLGGPYFHKYFGCDYADEWREEYRLHQQVQREGEQTSVNAP